MENKKIAEQNKKQAFHLRCFQCGLEARVPLLVLSGILLTVIQAPFNLSWLAWVAWTPFMMACGPDIPKRRLLPIVYVVGLCWWLGNLYWLRPVAVAGYIAFCLFQACYWPLLALSVQFVRRKGWPLFVAAPLIFVGAEAVQGVMLTGFSWYFLAHSQYQNLRLIQIADIFGALGVSVLIAMVNGLLAQAIIQKRIPRFRSVEVATVSILLAASWIYGYHQLAENHLHRTEGPLVGSVQSNLPCLVKGKLDDPQEVIDDLIVQSNPCINAGAELVVWPETMVLAAMNPGLLKYLIPDADELKYREQLLAHCKDRTYLLFGASSADVGVENGKFVVTKRYNSAFLYRPDGTPDPRIYHKIHLVPFGEYIPFEKSAPWLYKCILMLSPVKFDNLTAGTDYTIFSMHAKDGKEYRFGPLICYEDTDPTIARRMSLDPKTNKKSDWLVNLSQDGWYVKYRNERVIPTVEQPQRVAIAVFRSIENRISILRSVNTGISCLIDPSGQIRNGFIDGTLPQTAMKRQGVEGWFVDRIPMDDRITFFTRHGRWLDEILGTGWCVILILSIHNIWTQKPKSKERKK